MKAAAGRDSAGADGGELQSSAIEGNGLLAKGGIGWDEVEKSKGGGCDFGLSSNQTSLYSWMSRWRSGLAVGALSRLR